MKNFLFLLCALFFGLSAHSQATENVSFQKVVSFRGSFTTAERDLLDVPVGDVWMIYNSTTAILEYAREDDVWGAVGGGAADNLGADANRSLFTVSGSGTVATLNLNTVDSTHIKNGSIESNDFADNSITTVKILNGTIVGADLANDAILTGKIADGTILPADLDAVNAPVVGYHLALDASNQFVWVTPTAGSVAALADLSDVSSAIQGNRFVLVSNGTTFASRALVEADISDLAHTVNTDNQNARQVSVLDAGARFDSINVEGVLEELYDKWVVGNDDQVLTFVSPNLSIENGNSVDLSPLVAGAADDQTAAEVPVTTTNFNGNLSAADTNVQLALETLDDLVAGGSQTLSFTSPNLSISGGNSVDLSALQDGTGTDDQTAAEVPSTPSGNLAASNVQDALNELQTDINTRALDNTVVHLAGSEVITGSKYFNSSVYIQGVMGIGDSGFYLGEDDGVVGRRWYISKNQVTDKIQLNFQNADGSDSSGAYTNIYTLDETGVPTEPNDLTDKAYVDAAVGGVGDSQTLSFTSPNLSISGGNSVDLSAIDTNTQRTDEEIQDVAGAMATGNTETLITVTYQDADGTMDYVVNSDLSLYNNATSNFSTGAHTVNTDNQTLSFTSPNLSISGGNSISLAALDTNTQRTDEEIQDVVGAMVTTTNTETLITVTYQDATNDIDFVVNSDLSLYNNATSNFSTGAHTVDTDDQTAAEVPSTPSGNLAATNVQAALNELQTDVDTRSVGAHTVNTDNQTLSIATNNLSISGGNSVSLAPYLDNTDDQTATEVPFTPTGTIAATNVQSAIAEVASEAGDITGVTAGTGLSGGGASGGVTVSLETTQSPEVAVEMGVVNLNDYDTQAESGFYYQTTNADASAGTNYPEAVAGSFVVQPSAGGVNQQYYTYNDGSPEIWFRSVYNSSWSAWRKIWHSENDGAGSGLDADLFDGIQLAENTNQGPTWSRVPWMRSDGVTEVGTMFDFHLTSAAAVDYDMRLQAANNTTIRAIPGGTTSVLESYVGSQDWGRLGANTSGGYVQLSDGVGGSATTIRGYSDSDFYNGIRLHQGADLIMGTDAGSWRFDYIANNLTLYPGNTSGIFNIANSALITTFVHNTSTGVTTIGGSSPTLTMTGTAAFSNQTLSASTASTTKDTGALIIQNGGLGVEGAINAGGDVTAFATSDRRLKNNMRPISGATQKVLKLSGYEFDWDEYKQDLYQGHDIGLMAQEVRRVIPSAVRTGSNGYLQVDYRKAVPLLIEAIKEQEARIEALEKAVAKLLEK